MIPPRSGSAARVSPPFDSQGQIAAKRQSRTSRLIYRVVANAARAPRVRVDRAASSYAQPVRPNTAVGPLLLSTPGRFGERESQPPPHTATSKRYACRAMMLVRTCSRAISHVKALCMRRAGGRRGAGPVFRAVHINADLRTRRHAEDFQYPGLWSCPHARHVVAPAPTRKCATVSGKLPSGSMWHL